MIAYDKANHRDNRKNSRERSSSMAPPTRTGSSSPSRSNLFQGTPQAFRNDQQSRSSSEKEEHEQLGAVVVFNMTKKRVRHLYPTVSGVSGMVWDSTGDALYAGKLYTIYNVRVRIEVRVRVRVREIFLMITLEPATSRIGATVYITINIVYFYITYRYIPINSLKVFVLFT